jgi:hypothetical protein
MGAETDNRPVEYYNPTPHRLLIGAQEVSPNVGPSSNFWGEVDEVRLEGVVRDAAWIKLSYESQRIGGKLLSFAAASM